MRGDDKLGTTLRGIGPAYADKMRRVGIRAGDARDPERFARLIRERATVENKLIGEAGGDELDVDDMVERFSTFGARLVPYLSDTISLLHNALADDAKPGRIRQVVFITDGSVGNEDHIFSLIKKRLGKNRLFPIGIGSVPNSHLMTKIAEYGRGTFTYIGDISEVSTKMGEFFSRLENPVVTDIATRWPEGFVIDITPSVIPDLYQGEPLVIVAAMDEAATGPLQIDGLFAGQTWSQTINLENQQSEKGIGQVWARRKISEHMGDRKSVV